MTRTWRMAWVAALVAATQVQGQDVMTWLSKGTIAGDSDVITDGVLNRAYNMGGGYTFINGVPFFAFSASGAGPITSGATVLSESGKTVAAYDFGAITATPYGDLSSAYKGMLRSTVYQTAGVVSLLKLTLNELTVGHRYRFQAWVNFSDSTLSTGQRTQTVQAQGDTGSSEVMRWSSTPGTTGGVGDYVIGEFTAGAASLTLNFNGSSYGQINGFQLRDLDAEATWQAPQYLAGDSDVAVLGELDRAYCFNPNGDQTVNGVTFKKVAVSTGGTAAPLTVDDTVFGISGMDSSLYRWDASDAAAPWSSLSAAYKNMLYSQIYDITSTATLGLTLNGLTPGQSYLFQCWVSANGSSTAYSARTQAVSLKGDWQVSSAMRWSSTPGVAGGVGQYLIGTFVAASTSQEVHFVGSEAAQINAFQLRRLPPPPSGTVILIK